MTTRHTFSLLALTLSGASIALVGAVHANDRAAQPGIAPQFRGEQIASDFGVGYAVSTGDVNGDKRTDVVAISGTDLVWFEAPGWQKRIMLSGATPKDSPYCSRRGSGW